MKKIYTLLMAALCLAAVGCKQTTAEKATDMKYRPLGATGLEVSEISIGCGGFEKLDSAASLELMTMALDSGMNYIDIYDCTPKTRSNIGYALQGRRDEMIIQGHIGTIYKDGQHTRTRDVEECKASFQDLLDRLHTDHIEVGMIHITDSHEEWEEIQNSPFLDYVFQLKKEGKIKHIGLSSHNAEVALRAVKSGWVEVLMFSLNPAFDRMRGGTIPWEKGAFDNLQPETVYAIGVRSVCGEQRSDWTTRTVMTQESTDGIDNVYDAAFGLFPNPASTSVSIVLDEAATVAIVDQSGRTAASYSLEAGTTVLDLSQCASGVYYVRVVSTSGTSVRKLVVK